MCVRPKSCQRCECQPNSSECLLAEMLSTCLYIFFVCQLVFGPSGVLQGIRPSKCYVEMSTVDPETITELSQVWANRTHKKHHEVSDPSIWVWFWCTWNIYGSDSYYFTDLSITPYNCYSMCECQVITSRGGRFLEAPVAGSQQLSNDGMLVILAAGDRTVYEDCSSCFQAMGKTSFFLGM